MAQGVDIVEKLKFWRLEKFISVHQACMLAIGLDPYEVYEYEGWKDPKAPADYSKIYQELEGLILKEYFYTVLRVTGEIEGDDTLSDDDIYPPDAIFWPNNVIFKNGNELVAVRQTTVKKWLASNGIYCTYYDALPLNEPEGYITSTTVIKHTTRLLGIVDDVITRYYGDSYDPQDTDTITKQAYVVEWLKKTYSLSNREAEAIDIVTRPEIARKGKGKS